MVSPKTKAVTKIQSVWRGSVVRRKNSNKRKVTALRALSPITNQFLKRIIFASALPKKEPEHTPRNISMGITTRELLASVKIDPWLIHNIKYRLSYPLMQRRVDTIGGILVFYRHVKDKRNSAPEIKKWLNRLDTEFSRKYVKRYDNITVKELYHYLMTVPKPTLDRMAKEAGNIMYRRPILF